MKTSSPIDRFIYDEKTSSLYAPDGTFLKKVFCPKAKQWNQLIVVDGEDRWRHCEECKEKVLNLDVAEVSEVLLATQTRWNSVCVHASEESDRVIFLKDGNAPPRANELEKDEKTGLPIIYTARSMEEINRGAGMGFWPDVRLIQYDTENVRTKFCVGQNAQTGRIAITGDYRSRFRDRGDDEEDQWIEVIPFTYYYSHFQEMPLAAYLIPKDMPSGTEVIVADPIDDIVGSTWNQGSSYRAGQIRGVMRERKIHLTDIYREPSRMMG
jgi:hypothetical protein